MSTGTWEQNPRVQELVEKVKVAIGRLILDEPFLGYLAKQFTITLNPEVGTAKTNGVKITIGMDFAERLSVRQLEAVLAHEVMHAILLHPIRSLKILERLGYRIQSQEDLEREDVRRTLEGINVLEDAIVNERIAELMSAVPNVVYCNHLEPLIPQNECKERALEELVEMLIQKASAIAQMSRAGNLTFGQDVDVNQQLRGQDQNQGQGNKQGQGQNSNQEGQGQNQGNGNKGGKEGRGKGCEGVMVGTGGSCGCSRQSSNQPQSFGKGESQSQGKSQGQSQGQKGKEVVVQEGSIKPTDNPEELAREITRRVINASIVAKNIGRLPGWAERLIKDLLKPRVNWKVLLRSWLNEGERVKRTWSRQNRKVPVMPGKQLYGKITAWVLVDTSGSISDDELREFLTEVLGIASIGRIMVVFWDADVEGVVEVRTRADIPKMLRSVKGGGGTVIKPALEYASKRMKPNDWLIIMSDWYIGDIDRADVQEILKRHGDQVIAVKSKRATNPPKILKRVVELGVG